MGDWIVGGILLVMISLAGYSIFKDKKRGKACGSCKGCKGCGDKPK